jgi:pimeloyl-ACP methyl ester carboxylesterase
MPTQPSVAVCRQGDNVLNTIRVPIIFVPGVMGTRLHFTDINEYWDPDSEKWRMLHWARISAEREMKELDYTSPATVMTDQDKVKLNANEKGRGWEGMSWRSYGDFLRFLYKEKFSPMVCPIYCVGYDWRQSNKTSGTYLVNKIEEYMKKENAERIIILTHSMGGIVTRSALKESPALAGKVLGVVHVVQPATGAVVLYRRLFTGMMGDIDGGSGFSTVLGNTSDKFAAIVSGLPGPMELLPNKDYRDTGHADWLGYMENGKRKNWTGNVYDHYRGQTVPPGVPDSTEATGVRARLLARLNGAEKFHHEWLKGYYFPYGTWSIYSSGLETDMSIVFDPPTRPQGEMLVPVVSPYGGASMQKVPIPWVNYGAKLQRPFKGDGTVPGTSGSALFPNLAHKPPYVPNASVQQYVVSNVGHEPAYNESKDVQDLVVNLIRYCLTQA